MEKWEALYGKKKEGDSLDRTSEPKPEEKIQHQYEVLKGKYDAEVPRLAFELAEAKRRKSILQKRLDETIQSEEPKPTDEDNEKIKTFQEEYPDIYEGSSYLVKQTFNEALASFKSDLSKLKENVDAVQENVVVNKKQTFLDALDKDPEVGKEWRKLNEDEGFISWLQERAPYVGGKKHDVLMANWKQMDVDGTLEFFKDFKKNKKEIRERDKGDIITPDKLTAFANSVAKGEWKGRDKERDEEEKRLVAGVLRWKQKSLGK